MTEDRLHVGADIMAVWLRRLHFHGFENENAFLSGFPDASDGSFEYIIQRTVDRISTCCRTFIFSGSDMLSLPPHPFNRLPDPSAALLLLSHVFLLSPAGGHLPALWRFGLRPLLPVSRQQAVHAGEPLQRVHQRSALPSLLPSWSGEVPVLLQQAAAFGRQSGPAESQSVNESAPLCVTVSSAC